MQQPRVITWFKVYVGFMVLLYLVVAGGGLFLTLMPDVLTDPNAGPASNTPQSTTEAVVMGMIYMAIGLALAAAFTVGLFTPRRFWGWVYNLVLICIGLMSCCLWPATIPLIIFWVKEPTRQWYKVDQTA